MFWRDPRLGKSVRREQLSLQPSVGPVGLGPLLPAPLLGGVGRLRNVCLHPCPLELLDDEPPARAPFESKGHVLAPLETRQPRPEVVAVCRRDLAAAHLAGVGVQVVERDLSAMNVEPTYDGHGDLLKFHRLLPPP